VPKLCQMLLLNRGRARIQRHLIGLAVHFLQSLSLHLQFHLRILLKDLGVALPEELCNPFVCDTACTKSGCVSGAQIIDPEVGNSCPFQCLPPRGLEILLVTGRILVVGNRNGPGPAFNIWLLKASTARGVSRISAIPFGFAKVQVSVRFR